MRRVLTGCFGKLSCVFFFVFPFFRYPCKRVGRYLEDRRRDRRLTDQCLNLSFLFSYFCLELWVAHIRCLLFCAEQKSCLGIVYSLICRPVKSNEYQAYQTRLTRLVSERNRLRHKVSTFPDGPWTAQRHGGIVPMRNEQEAFNFVTRSKCDWNILPNHTAAVVIMRRDNTGYQGPVTVSCVSGVRGSAGSLAT